MSTPDKTLFRVLVARRSGVTPRQHMDFVRKAIANYKAGMFPDDPFFDYTEDDVQVFSRRRRHVIGYALLCRENKDFPKYFQTQEEAQKALETYPNAPPVVLVSLIAAELRGG